MAATGNTVGAQAETSSAAFAAQTIEITCGDHRERISFTKRLTNCLSDNHYVAALRIEISTALAEHDTSTKQDHNKSEFGRSEPPNEPTDKGNDRQRDQQMKFR
ncbi:hypothetical protein [Bradyrhizobium cenepequi]